MRHSFAPFLESVQAPTEHRCEQVGAPNDSFRRNICSGDYSDLIVVESKVFFGETSPQTSQQAD